MAGREAAGATRCRNRARPRTAVGCVAPAVPAPWPLVCCSDNNDTTRLGYISPGPARLNGNTFTESSLPSAAARRCADHALSEARFSSAQSCL
jgi:hypothetical protein